MDVLGYTPLLVPPRHGAGDADHHAADGRGWLVAGIAGLALVALLELARRRAARVAVPDVNPWPKP